MHRNPEIDAERLLKDLDDLARIDWKLRYVPKQIIALSGGRRGKRRNWPI